VPASTKQPITTVDEYHRAAEELKRRLADDAGASALAYEIERVLRFELEQPIPPEDRFSAQLIAARQPRARRTALISDIHGNHAGLVAALADIERQHCDRILCLGDLVEGGPENEAVVETLRRLHIPCVRGNHDENNDLSLADSTRDFLMHLPERIVEDDVLYVHISPRRIKRKVDHEVEAWNVFDETAYSLIFIGHVHISYIFGKRSALYGEATRQRFEYNQPFSLARDDSYVVSVGSVGYGRDKIGKIRYAIYDREARTVELRAIDGPLLPLDHVFIGGAAAPAELV
jgi:predicted phosphodiesterase